MRGAMAQPTTFLENCPISLDHDNGILKTEFLLQRPADLGQARRMVEQSVRIYNCERPHLSLKMQTPDAVHRASLAGQSG